jgi:HEAT repeat protein
MTMQNTRRVLNVFLASPGDVVEEREIAAEVVDRLNKSIGPKFAWHIDLHRWEDTKPAYGRPQSIINPAVDACDLFIGLLWERWGQPTGTYSSGFQEEFERATSRRESSGRPEIWLVFKKPRSDKLEDRGPELTRVLEFREAQKKLRRVLFREVHDCEEWKTNLHDWLFDHVWNLCESGTGAAQRPPAEPPAAAQTSETSTSDGVLLAGRSAPEVAGQLAELSGKVSRVVSSANLEFLRSDADVLGEFEIVRLYLLSATWMASRYTSDFLGTHESNLFYKHRGQLKATLNEEYQMLRTVLQDSSDVIPGWFWFREAFSDGPVDVLLIATRDSNASLRARTLKLLASAQIQISKELWPSLPLSDESEAVSAEALRYLGLMGDESVLPLIEKVAQGNDHSLISSAAMEARLRILTRVDAGRTFSELMSSEQYVPGELARVFADVADALGTQDLIKGAEAPGDEIKTFSVKELARRGELPLKLAERLRDDASIDVKQIALQVIVNKGGEGELQKLREAVKPDPLYRLLGHREVDLNLIAFDYYRTLPPEKLLMAVDWLSVDGPTAYKVLALDHFDILSGLIRNDLNTGFERIRKKFFDDRESEIGAEAVQQMSQRLQLDNLDDFIRSGYIEAALSGLANHGEQSDIQFGRKHLGDDDRAIRLEAARIVSRFGDERDVQLLLDASDNAWGELEALGPAAALRLSPDPQRLAIEMTRSDSRGRSKAARRWLVGQDSPEVRDYFRGLLNDGDESERILGVQYLSKRVSRAELEQLLDEYGGTDTYYYNVVTWLDRLLYAPSPLREMFARDLDQGAGTSL